MSDDHFGGLALMPWQAWLRQYVDGGPEKLAEKAEKAGAPVEIVNEARRIRRQQDEEKSQWLRDEVGEGAIDRPVTAKVIPAVHDVPGASLGQAAGGSSVACCASGDAKVGLLSG